MRAIIYGIFIYFIFNFTPVKAQQLPRMQGGHCFTLDVPIYMVKTYELNDVASLQYLNKTRETYALVIVDTKEELAAGDIKFMNAREFLDQFLSTYNPEVKKLKKGTISEFVENNNGHAQVEMTWETEDDQDLYMMVTIVETEKAFYQIVSWTMLESKETYKPDFVAMSRSLKD